MDNNTLHAVGVAGLVGIVGMYMGFAYKIIKLVKF